MDSEVWELTEDELDKLAAHARYGHDSTVYFNVSAWGELPLEQKRAWMNAVAAILFSLDKMGKTAQTVVIDYD